MKVTNLKQSFKVPETEDEGSPPEYQEFCNILLNSQKIANETQKAHVFIWRGYKGCVSSQIPKLTVPEMKRRFNLAMESISNEKKKKEVRMRDSVV